MFVEAAKKPAAAVAEGLTRKVLSTGEQIMVVEMGFRPGAGTPPSAIPHFHAYEQIGYVISGKVEVTVGGETRILSAGDSYLAGPQVEHTAYAIEESVMLEVFSPPRADLIGK